MSMEDYHLLNQIGEGSFGRVYMARRKYTGRLVAIKMINKLGQSQDDKDSFSREIDLLTKVNHPNIMKMLHVFETDTEFCVVSELGRGDLFQIIDDNQTLPEEVIRPIAAQLVSALAHLHSQRIIHRDMKPQNILIASNGSLKLCDFGFARALSNTTLVLTSIKGTPLYMAPELVQEQAYDEKIDIWSLGIILYELYYGKPPFFTNSIYKLIQMIVNSSITWPDPISEQFKNFLLRMLQKDPALRVSAKDLLQDPFIASVDLTKYGNRVQEFKMNQFNQAIETSLSGPNSSRFNPPKSKIPDYQMIFISPSTHSPNELRAAAEYLVEKHISGDSPLAAAFGYHFDVFLNTPESTDATLRAASYLLKIDPERFVTPFAVGISLLGDKNMPISAIDFFTQLLSIPFAENIIAKIDFQLGDMQITDSKGEILRDRLLSFMLGHSNEEVGKTCSLLSFFAQESPEVLRALSGRFAPQLIPILTALIIRPSSDLVLTSALAVMTKVIEASREAFKFIQPLSQFVSALKQVLNREVDSISKLCSLGSALSFTSVCLDQIAGIPEFQTEFSLRESLSDLQPFAELIFGGENRLESLLEFASIKPETEEDALCYSSSLTSPFLHLPLSEYGVDACVSSLPMLVAYHQPSLLQQLLNLPHELIRDRLPDMVSMFAAPACCDLLSSYILTWLPDPSNKDLAMKLAEAGALIAMAGTISDMGPDVPPNVVLCLANIIMCFNKPIQILYEQSTEILNSVFAIDTAIESALLIAINFLRLSPDFIEAINECGALKFAERGLLSDIFQIKERSLDFIGVLAQYGPLPDDFLQYLDHLLEVIHSNEPALQKLAALALGNIVPHTQDVRQYIMTDADSLIELLKSDDPKVVENVAALLGNLAREPFAAEELIKKNILVDLVQNLNEQEKGAKIIPQISVFCLYKSGRDSLRAMNAQSIIKKYSNSKNDRAKRNALKILDVLDKKPVKK